MIKDIFYIDMDGVLADFSKAIIERNPHLNIDMEDFSTWGDFVDEYCEANPRIFLDLEFIEGAQEAVPLLNEKYNIYFLSTPMHGVPESYMDKRLWLGKWFPEISYKKLILTHNKGLCMGKYLVDDRIKNGVEHFTGEHIHFGSKKFPDWATILNYVL